MSNQPKITYRSDSAGLVYQMVTQMHTFSILPVTRDGEATRDESPCYAYLTPWRLTINRFFDIVDNHINTGEWIP